MNWVEIGQGFIGIAVGIAVGVAIQLVIHWVASR